MSDRQRAWKRLLQRAARRDRAVAESQRSPDTTLEDHARRVWLADEALQLVLRMSKGEF